MVLNFLDLVERTKTGKKIEENEYDFMIFNKVKELVKEIDHNKSLSDGQKLDALVLALLIKLSGGHHIIPEPSTRRDESERNWENKANREQAFEELITSVQAPGADPTAFTTEFRRVILRNGPGSAQVFDYKGVLKGNVRPLTAPARLPALKGAEQNGTGN